MTTNYTQLITYNVTDSVLAELEQKASVLQIASVEDKVNYELVDTTRKEAKRLKIEVEKRRKELKSEALAFGKKVDEEAEKYSSRLIAIEKDLEAKQEVIDKEKAKIKLAKEQEAKLPGRKILLTEFTDGIPSDEQIKSLSDLEFQSLVQQLVGARQEKIRIEQEAERKKLEEEKLKIQKEQEEQAKKIAEQQEAERKAEQERMDAERKKLEEEKAKLEEEKRKVQEEADRIAKEESDRVAKEAWDKKFKEQQEAAEKERLLLLEIDEKVNKWKVENNYNEETDIIEDDGQEVILYRKVSTLTITTNGTANT